MVPALYCTDTVFNMPSAHYKTALFFSPHKVSYFLSQKEKQKMLGANGGPAISPTYPSVVPFHH
ncbi:hypothetical protein HU200_049729 [Digitaria exilis]|uniref:Uncharacterized protein n=1 Tax=Digitaria exilis TaxID=1010633 RepID=A0A835AYD8_9POAL|nr:hypothetical protein HU200_049729 [Digitaria exilis]